MSEIAPTVPGKISPGFQSSTTIPISPIESMSVIRFGIDEEIPSALPEAHLDVLDLRAGGLQDEALGHGLRPVDLVQERGQGRGDHLDEPDRLGLTSAVVRRLRDHPPGGGDVAVVLTGELAHVRRGVVDDLPPQVLGDVLAAERDRGRGADVRLRRHRGDVGGHRDHRAGGVGARAGRRDVQDHRNRRSEEALDDPAHRGGEPSRRVEDDDDRVELLVLGTIDRVLDVLLRDGVDVVVEMNGENLRPRVLAEAHRRHEEREKARRREEIPAKGGSAPV